MKNIKIKRLSCFLTVLVFVFVVFSGSSSVFAVDDFDFIQNKVDSGTNMINLGNETYIPGSVNTVLVNKDSVVIKGSSANSKAVLDGGGSGSRIMSVTGDNVHLENLVFKNADVNAFGGALASYGVNLTIVNCEFVNNKAMVGAIILSNESTNAVIQNCVFVNNQAAYSNESGGGGGGAIDSHSSNGQIINCTFTNNTAIEIGGALYFIFGSNNTVTGCTFQNNTAPHGGAIYTGTAGTTLKISRSTFANNKANNNGGAIYSTNLLSIDGSNFTRNFAPNGGSIYSIANLNVTNSVFKENNATNGGAIRSTSVINIRGSVFDLNKASNGGAIYSTNTLNMVNNNFTNNKATNNGGGIYTDNVLAISGSSFVNNVATNNGGGISVLSTSRTTIASTKFTSNSAKNGGGVYNNAPLAISNSYFNSNKANANGGAIYANKNLNISGGSLTSNSAGYGSGIYNLANLRVSKVSISSNIANVISISLKTPTVVKPGNKLTVNIYLKTGDNILGAIYNSKGNTYINGSRKTPSDKTPDKIFSSAIAGSKKSIKSNINGVAARTYTVSKTAKKVVVSVSYSQGGKKWTISESVKVSSTAPSTPKTKTYTNKKSVSTASSASSGSGKSGSSVTVSLLNHENSHLASLVNMSKYTISSKKISYWNLKKESYTAVTDSLYKVNKDGWYSGTINSKGGVVWNKMSRKPSTTGTWFNLSSDSNTSNSKRKYSIGKIVPKYANNTSESPLSFFVSVKTSISHKSLTPYISYTYELVNKNTKTKKTVRFFEKSDISIYFASYLSASEIKNYSGALKSTYNCHVNNSAIKKQVVSMISKISGELTPKVKAVAIFNWLKNRHNYRGYSDTWYGAVNSLNLVLKGKIGQSLINCADQAHLTIALYRTMGIPAFYEHGYCKFKHNSSGHYWAKIYISGKWYMLDTTNSGNGFNSHTWKLLNIIGRYYELNEKIGNKKISSKILKEL
ncbi:putative outer membrane protein PmpI precursor [Methanobrevibacter cuticularis]|uniref:Putative outer membrane protein PmpI n=1 Tax=Methanobrevibacter cuticularis TaxID=47311 RepID=A0A166CJZ1_9EURY|nr:transglutaminase family protein [Methanobrevibacter cuticularis]KZX14917.1 putative outer membrane protein PmpI precursor [Methanobrevibacter cuticularis]